MQAKRITTLLIICMLALSMIVPCGLPSYAEEEVSDTPETTEPVTEPEKENVESVNLYIKSAGSKISVNDSKWYMIAGRSSKLIVRPAPAANAQSVKYSSSDKSIAKVSSSGKIAAFRKGKAAITVRVRAKDGTSVKAKLTVCVLASSLKTNAKYHGVSQWKFPVRKIGKHYKKKPQSKVVFVGSSSIRKWKTLKKDFPSLKVLNHGFGGSTVNDCLYYADDLIIPYKPAAIVFYAGTNDIAFGYSARTIYKRTLEFINYIHCRLPDTPIYYVAQTKQPKRTGYWSSMSSLNSRVSKYCKTDDLVTYIDTTKALNKVKKSVRAGYFLRDGLHFTRKGYKVWSSVIRPVLYKDLRGSAAWRK